jgi:DNA primase
VPLTRRKDLKMLAPHQPSYQSSPPDHTYGFRKCCEAVREAVPIEEIARRYTDLEPLGGRAWFDGRCPLPDHEDKTPSFYIYPPGRFYCYGCNRGGDVVDLEFFCGDYGELWEAMISLAVDYSVELPERSPSWRRKPEREKPVRDGIEAEKIHAARRRLYRRFFEPVVLATIDAEDREHDAQLFWEATAPLAEHLVAHMMGSHTSG